jgi:hypothetical protein
MKLDIGSQINKRELLHFAYYILVKRNKVKMQKAIAE